MLCNELILDTTLLFVHLPEKIIVIYSCLTFPFERFCVINGGANNSSTATYCSNQIAEISW